MRSGTIVVMACRLVLVSRGFRRRRRSLQKGWSAHLSPTAWGGVASGSGIVMVSAMVGGQRGLLGHIGCETSYSQCAVKLCVSHGCEGRLYICCLMNGGVDLGRMRCVYVSGCLRGST